MPNYAIVQSGGSTSNSQLTALQPGDAIKLFDAESPAAPQASVAFVRAMGPGGVDGGTTFTVAFAAAPTDSLVIQGSNADVEAQYQTIFTSTNKQFDLFTDTARWAFYRAKLVTQSAGGAVTVVAQR